MSDRRGSREPYRFPTRVDQIDALAAAKGIMLEELQDGRRMRNVENVIAYTDFLHRHARATGHSSFVVKREAVCAALYPEVRREWQLKSLQRWEALGERAGLFRVRDARGERGLRVELLDGWQRYAVSCRGYSSVGDSIAPEPCEVRRRPETRRERQERRVRPHARRTGNCTPRKEGLVPRLEVVPAEVVPSLKHPEKMPPSGLGRDGGPQRPRRGLGVPPPSPTFGLHAGAPRAVDNSADAACSHPGDRRGSAAPEPPRQRRDEQWQAEAERLFEQAFGPPRGGPLRDAGPLLAALERYDRAGGRIAAMNGWSPAPPGRRALQLLQSLIAGETTDRRRPPVRHLGWFVPAINKEAGRLERKLTIRRRQDREARAALGRRLAGLLAIELVERLRDPDPARGGRGSRPRARRGSGARRT